MKYINLRLVKIAALLVIILAIAVLGSGCASPSKEIASDSAYSIESAAPGEYYEQDVYSDGNLSEEGLHKISSGDVNLKVENLDDSVRSIEEKANNLGGFVSYSYINKKERNPYAQITVKVPADKFNLMLLEIEKIGEVESRSTSEEDVTRRYIDLEARINNLTSQEKRLTEILQMADKVEDVLAVEKELERVREQIEVLTGEFNYLKSQVNMSAISIRLSEAALAASGVASLDIKDVFTKGYHSLINSINAILMFVREFIIFIMGAVPFIILAAAVIILLRKPFRSFKESREKGKTLSDKENIQG